MEDLRHLLWAEVVNTLVGVSNVYAYDRSLDKKSEDAYEELKDIIMKKHQGHGVLSLLSYFHKVISPLYIR